MEKTVKVGLSQGLHASNAAALVERASQFKADVHLKKKGIRLLMLRVFSV